MNQTDRLATMVDRLDTLISRLEKNSSVREIRLRQALHETVKTLETTKKAFHSKQLKQLRERVEAALNEE